MADTTDMNYSSLENRLVEKNLQKDNSLAIKNAIQQSINEERIANNGLFLNLMIHLAIFVVSSIIIWGRLNLVINNQSHIINSNRLRFNLIDFSFYNNTDRSSIEFKYNCISKVNMNETYACYIDKTCMGLSEILLLFRENICDEIDYLKDFGIVVKIN